MRHLELTIIIACIWSRRSNWSLLNDTNNNIEEIPTKEYYVTHRYQRLWFVFNIFISHYLLHVLSRYPGGFFSISKLPWPCTKIWSILLSFPIFITPIIILLKRFKTTGWTPRQFLFIIFINSLFFICYFHFLLAYLLPTIISRLFLLFWIWCFCVCLMLSFQICFMKRHHCYSLWSVAFAVLSFYLLNSVYEITNNLY
jgi:hypothetical protein